MRRAPPGRNRKYVSADSRQPHVHVCDYHRPVLGDADPSPEEGAEGAAGAHRSLQRGDKVITNAGLHGFVEKVNERTVSLKIAEAW